MMFNRYGCPTHLQPWRSFGAASGNTFEVDYVADYRILHQADYNVLTYDERDFGLSGSGNGGLRAECLEAAQSRDLDRIMKTYYPGPGYLAYDVRPPFIFEGWDTFRAHWKNFFEMFDVGPAFERADTKIHCSVDVAFSTGFTRFVGLIDGKAFDIWARETHNYRKFEGNWQIIHDHVSVPIDLNTGIGVTDYKP